MSRRENAEQTRNACHAKENASRERSRAHSCTRLRCTPELCQSEIDMHRRFFFFLLSARPRVAVDLRSANGCESRWMVVGGASSAPGRGVRRATNPARRRRAVAGPSPSRAACAASLGAPAFSTRLLDKVRPERRMAIAGRKQASLQGRTQPLFAASTSPCRDACRRTQPLFVASTWSLQGCMSPRCASRSSAPGRGVRRAGSSISRAACSGTRSRSARSHACAPSQAETLSRVAAEYPTREPASGGQ